MSVYSPYNMTIKCGLYMVSYHISLISEGFYPQNASSVYAQLKDYGPLYQYDTAWTIRNFIMVLKSLWMVKTSIWPGESDWCLFKDHKSNFWWFLKCHSYQFWTCMTLTLWAFYSCRILYNLQYNKRPKIESWKLQ